MKHYTIPCTEEQTRMALELGAPLEIAEGKNTVLCRLHNYHTYKRCVIPTAEQMIGWLEEQINVREICVQRYGDWWYQIYIDPYFHLEQKGLKSRKEATLAAIDAALEYLINQKSK